MKTKKKLSAFCSLLAGAFILFAFASCADVAGSKDGGSVSFVFDENFVERLATAARAGETDDGKGSGDLSAGKAIFEVEIGLRGDYSATKAISFEYTYPSVEMDDGSMPVTEGLLGYDVNSGIELTSSARGGFSSVPSQTLTFENIPDGASVYAVGLVQVTETRLVDNIPTISKALVYIGVSDSKKISGGMANDLSLVLKTAGFNDVVAYGKAEGYEDDFMLSLKPGNNDKSSGYWAVIYGGILVSTGKYSVLEFGTTEINGERPPKRLSATEYIYLPESDLMNMSELQTSDSAENDELTSYSYQIASRAKTSELDAGDGGHFIFTSANGVMVKFGLFPTYNLTINKDGETLYSDSGDWMRNDDSTYLSNFNDAVKDVFEKIGVTAESASNPYKIKNTIEGLTYTLSSDSEPISFVEREAFFPKPYDSSKVKAWFSLCEDEEKTDSYQTKTLSLYLFEDGKLLATKFKRKYLLDVETENVTVEREIERVGTYTLTTADNFETNSGIATFDLNGKTVTYKFGIFNGIFFAYATEQTSSEDLDIMAYTVREDDVPPAINPDEPSGSSGEVSVENNLLEISISDTSVAMNGSLTFSAKDTDENDVTNDVSFNAQLLYKGTDVNDLAPVSSAYYIITDNKLTLSNPLPKAGTYQLYVTATWTGVNTVTSSQTFEITVKDEYVTPETQIALYKYNSEYSSYNYTFVDSNDVATATVPETSDFSGMTNNVEFDAFGNSYVYNGTSVYSNSNLFTNDGLSLASELESYTQKSGIAIDVAKNMAYGWGLNEQTVALFKYPMLISDGSSYDVINYSVSPSGFYTSDVAINDNVLYVLGDFNDDGTHSIQIWAYDISNGLNSNSEPMYQCNLDDNLPEELSFAKSNSYFYSDMYAIDGALYLLVRQNNISQTSAWTYSNGTVSDLYSRGAIIKVSGENSVYVKALTNSSIAQNTITQMYLYYQDSSNEYSSPAYTDNTQTTVTTMLADSTTVERRDSNGALEEYGKTDGYKFFPNVYALSSDTNTEALAGPARIIGIKPKKLVIADDGYAFYTDATGALCYKNVNRVVTIDLEDFVSSNMQFESTSASFEKELSGYLRSSISIDTVRSGATYYDYRASVYYYNSSMNEQSSTIGWGENIYLSVKNGDNE